MTDILIIDNDEQFSKRFCLYFTGHGYETASASSLEDGRSSLESNPFTVIFLNNHMPDGDSLSFLQQTRETPGTPEVILMSTDIDPHQVRMAFENGAWDFISKPLPLNTLKTMVESVHTYREQKKALGAQKNFDRGEIIGNSASLEENIKLATHAAESDVSVLIYSETGTGKELFANVIHDNSNRSGYPMVVVDCAALSEQLAESTLFGHVKGSFTGANANREGLIKQADGGTLFLDEIGELPLELQKTFLRVLQEKKFRPLGSKSEIYSDFRLISATNRDLALMAGEGNFRDDLLFRIQSLVLTPAPLRERKQDIPDIVINRVTQQCQLQDDGVKKVSSEFLKALQLYSWPGNVRELINTIDSCLARSRGESILFPRHLPVQFRIQVAQASERLRQSAPATLPVNQDEPLQASLPDLKQYRKSAAREAEKGYLKKLVNMHHITVDEACRISGLSRSRFYELLKRYKLPTPKITEALSKHS